MLDSYAELNVDSNEKDPKFKVGDRVRISKFKNIFVKGRKKFLLLAKLKIQFHGLVISDLNGKKLLEPFMKKNC